MKNQAIIDAIVAGALQIYKDRIPTGDQTDFATTGTAILEDEVVRNDFLNALVDKIGLTIMTDRMYKNKLAVLKKGKLDYGYSIEQVFVDLIEAQQFDPDSAQNTLFKRVLPKVSAIYYTMNSQREYTITISRRQLRTALLTENGLNNLVNSILKAPQKSNQYDEYLFMRNLFQAYATEGLFEIVTVPAPTDEASIKQIMVEIKAMSNELEFMSNDHNSAGVTTHTLKDNQVVFITPRFDAQVDVELLASAFNMPKSDFEQRKMTVDNFGGATDVLAVVADEDWMQVWDVEMTTEEARNGKGLYTNYFLHVWQIFATNRFANAVAFQTATPTLTAIDIEPATATVPKKGSLQFYVRVVTGTNNVSSAVTYEHDGASADTFVSPVGLLYVGSDETVSPITVTATSKFDTGVSDTAVITVS